MGSALFERFVLRGVELANRIVVSPMAQYSAQDGCATDWHLMHLGSLAASGAGLIVTEATAVARDGLGSAFDLGLWNDAQAAALERVLAFGRRHGRSRFGVQLYHAGRKGSITVAWEGQKHIPESEGGWAVRGACAIPYPGRGLPTPLDAAGIADTIGAFVAAARRADAIGVDLLELHAAHGYLLNGFLSPLSNDRTDGYGGSRDGRMRFVLEVFAAVRDAWPEHKPIGVRISATDWAPGGWEIDDSVELSRRLRALGCDYVTPSSGGTVPEQRPQVAPGYQVPFAARIRREAGIATMAVGLITEARQAQAIVAGGDADLVAIGRAMLHDPRWPWHAAIELGEPYFCPPQYLRSHPAMRSGDPLRPVRPAGLAAT